MARRVMREESCAVGSSMIVPRHWVVGNVFSSGKSRRSSRAIELLISSVWTSPAPVTTK